jgi:hypothetical protein
LFFWRGFHGFLTLISAAWGHSGLLG